MAGRSCRGACGSAARRARVSSDNRRQRVCEAVGRAERDRDAEGSAGRRGSGARAPRSRAGAKTRIRTRTQRGTEGTEGTGYRGKERYADTATNRDRPAAAEAEQRLDARGRRDPQEVHVQG